MYLAWVTDLGESSLQLAATGSKGKIGGAKFDSRTVPRRFAIPCFESTDGPDGEKRAIWAKRIMSEALLRAQILADTLHGKWNGLFIGDIVPLIRSLDAFDTKKLSHLLMGDAAVREPIAAGASRFDSAIGEPKGPTQNPIRRFLLVVDAGAGTTDIALFQVITPAGETKAKYALLRKSVRMCRIAGNEIDGILRPIILNACGVDEEKLSPDDLAYAKIDLDSRVRDIKQLLFEKGNISIELRPHLSGSLDLPTLLSDAKMKQNGKELIELRQGIFSQLLENVDIDELRSANDGRPMLVHVLLTGGSSVIPIIAQLATGELNVRGLRIRFEKIDSLPTWVNRLPREIAQLVGSIYPQSAVAIGGSAPDLPKELNDMENPVTPARKGVRRLPRTQITGT